MRCLTRPSQRCAGNILRTYKTIRSLAQQEHAIRYWVNSSVFINLKSVFLLLVLPLIEILTVVSTDAQEIVVNPTLHEQNLTLNALRAIFGMRLRSWPDGTPIKVFVLSDDAKLHVSFSKKKLEIYPHQLRDAWDRLVYSGTGQAPIRVASEEEMRKMVSGTVGAIGYLPPNLIDDSVHILAVKMP